jgi:Predicted integral membrane protein (DUF2269)
MTYLVLGYVHLLGLTLMGAGLIGVWYADLRSRQVRDLNLPLFGELIRQIAVFYDGLVVPGALLLLGSGTWLIASTSPPSRTFSVCRCSSLSSPSEPCGQTPGHSSWPERCQRSLLRLSSQS